MSTVLVALILLLVMIVFLAIGAWIPVAIAVTSWVGLVIFSDHDALVNLANSWWSSSASYTLASLPLFVWMGEILFRTKLSEQMFNGLSRGSTGCRAVSCTSIFSAAASSVRCRGRRRPPAPRSPSRHCPN
jgi:TRAP-type mannitol/chloroaromatic compound transport system permease large subunit